MPTSAVSGGVSPSGNAPSGVTGTTGGSGFGFSVAPGTFGQVGSVAASSPGTFGNPPTVNPIGEGGGHLGFMYGADAPPGLLGDSGSGDGFNPMLPMALNLAIFLLTPLLDGTAPPLAPYAPPSAPPAGLLQTFS